MVLKEEEEGFFHSSGKTLGVLEAADHELNFVKKKKKSSIKLYRMKESECCCFDNYSNKNKVR